ncbi:septation protein SepH [Naumannella huperziae]
MDRRWANRERATKLRTPGHPDTAHRPPPPRSQPSPVRWDSDRSGSPARPRRPGPARRRRPHDPRRDTRVEIGLTPREIQSRIRAGASLEEVAEAAGAPSDKIRGFAAPVLAEREHVAALALAAPVRRRGEGSAHRTLNVAVTDKLGSRGVRAEQIDWDAWRREDRRWTLVARYELGAAPREAVFYFNQQNRFSVPANDDARWLTGELSALPGAPDDPTEPTVDLNDELALVRALREPESDDPVRLPGDDADPPPVRLLHPPAGDEADEPTRRIELGPEAGPPAPPDLPLPRSQPTPQDIGQEIEAELANYDNGPATGGLDLLYDFLDRPGDRQDYAGLAPEEPEQPSLDFDAGPDEPVRDEPARDEPAQDEPVQDEPVQDERVQDEPVQDKPGPDAPEHRDPTGGDDAAPSDTARDTSGKPTPEKSPTEASDEAAEETVRVPRTRKKRSKRAAVPSWDEIMFGGPGNDEE